jgi:type II secretory pathway component GspD/PulD (secretin)
MTCARFPMRPMLILLGVALVLSLGAEARAGDAADPETYRSYDVGGGLVTLDVQDAPFGQVVREQIQTRTRVNIDVSKAAADLPVTIKVVDLHWILALDAMCDKIGAFLVRKAPNLLVVERPKPVEMAFDDEDVKVVIKRIAEYAGANVIVSPEVQGKITLNLVGTPWMAALKQVVETVGDYALVEEDHGIYRVIPSSQLRLDSDIYRFRFLRPPPVYKGVMATASGSSGSGGGSSTGGSSGSNTGSRVIYSGEPVAGTDDPKAIEDNFPIIAALRQIVEQDQGGNVKYMPSENAVLFTGTKPNIQKLKSFAQRLDVEPPQVFIDMNFIVTNANKALNLGLKAGSTSGVGGGISGSDIIHMLPFNVGGGNALANALTGTAFPPPASSSFSYGTLTTSETNLLWDFLQRDSSTRIVQAPKLLALDNQAATIFIGETIRYARSSAATNQNGGLEFSIEEDPNSPVTVGFQLLVIPHVVPGERKIQMTVIPDRRALTGSGPLPGFDRITVSGQSIDLPRVQSSTLVTHMILRDKQTAVIGGLLEDRKVERVDKVPFLGDLPIGGLLFQGRGTEVVKEHLLITITPKILTGSDAANCTISDELCGRSGKVAAEYRDLEGCDLPVAGGAPAAPSAGALPPPAVPASVPAPSAPSR